MNKCERLAEISTIFAQHSMQIYNSLLLKHIINNCTLLYSVLYSSKRFAFQKWVVYSFNNNYTSLIELGGPFTQTTVDNY